MVDFHAHVLPGIDDGSKSVEMSLEMLRTMKAQGIDTVCCTSHFYVTQNKPETFLAKRQDAYERLMDAYDDDLPDLRLGAEVLYFEGISRLESLSSLCLEGTPLLLLEMPFETFTEYMIREVIDMAHYSNIQLVMAHIERYLDTNKAKVFDRFLENDILMQCNASFFLRFPQRLKALKMFNEGRIHLLGSDAHNMSSRMPQMGDALDYLARKADKRMFHHLLARSENLLEEE